MSNILKAALYARYSTDKQSEASIPDQFRVCERFAAQHGFTVAVRFEDAAISGGTTRRPGYQAMLAAARRSEFEVIVAEDQSRLWRNSAEQSPRLAELADLGIFVVTHDLDTRQESAGILGAVTGAMSEQYRREIGRRTRRGLEGRAREGKPTGGRAYGFIAARDSASKGIEVNKTEARVVQRIFKAYAHGKSPRHIAAELNTAGIHSPGAQWNRKARRKDGKWLQTAVRAILRNERYLGHVVWGRMKWKRKVSDSSQRTKVVGDSPPITRIREDLRIIDDKLWNAVQRRIREAQPTQGQPSATVRQHQHPLSGLLKCGQCNASFVIADSYTYACASHRDGGKDACPIWQRVRRADVERAIYDGVAEQLSKPEWLEEFSAWFRQQVTIGQKARAATAATSSKRLATVERQISNVTEAIVRGELSGSRAVADKLRALEQERDQLVTNKAPASNVVNLVPRLEQRLSALVKDLPAIARKDPDRARMLLRRLGGHILLVPDENDELEAEFEVTGSRLALAVGAMPGPREIGGSGGRI